MKSYPKVFVCVWKIKNKIYKDLWWHIGKGLYLDTFTLCFYGAGQESSYDQLVDDPNFRLLNSKEQIAFNNGNLRDIYKQL
jgi:hypothetical protein